MKLLDRHIATQYFETLCVATVMIGGIFLGTSEYKKVLDWICNIGMDWHKACLVSFLQLPSICIFALPAGTLIATILVLYRLNSDGELLAMRMAGVSHMRLMMPFFALSITAATISFSLSEFVSPKALSAASQLLRIAAFYCRLPVTKTAIAIVEPVKNQSGETKEKRLMMVGRNLDNSLKNVTIFDLVDNQVNLIHWAENGYWRRGQWQLAQGRTYSLRSSEKESEPATVGTSSFSMMVIDTIASKIKAQDNDGPIPEHKTIGQLTQLIDDLKAQNKPIPPDVLIDFYHRYSQPLACLLLVVAAFPIAVGNHRRGHASGMIYGGVMTTAYFLIQEITQALGYQGRMEPCLAVWLPSVSLMTLGLICLTVKIVWQRD
jgi:lipopolysaccharide export system permease protein